jgi:hypothetical protein
LVLGFPYKYRTPREGIKKIGSRSALTLQKYWKICLDSLLRFLHVKTTFRISLSNLTKKQKMFFFQEPKITEKIQMVV